MHDRLPVIIWRSVSLRLVADRRARDGAVVDGFNLRHQPGIDVTLWVLPYG